MKIARTACARVMILLFLSGQGSAAPDWTGRKLAQVCAESRAGDCAMFIRGVMDRYHEFIATRCVHQEVRFSELVATVAEALAKGPPGES